MTKQSEAEKAAEEHNRECLNTTVDPSCGRYGVSNYESFLAGAAWAAPKWVSVKERLPTKDKRGVPADSILAYGVNPERYQTWKDKFGKALEHKERYIACFVPEYGFLKNGYYFRTETEKALVTHWMPLPAAPEVEK